MTSIDPNAVLYNSLNLPTSGSFAEKSNLINTSQGSQKKPNDFEELLTKIAPVPDSKDGEGRFANGSNLLFIRGGLNKTSLSDENAANKEMAPTIDAPLTSSTSVENLSLIIDSMQSAKVKESGAADVRKSASTSESNSELKIINPKKLIDDHSLDVSTLSGSQSDWFSDLLLLSSAALNPIADVSSSNTKPPLQNNIFIQTKPQSPLLPALTSLNTASPSITMNTFIVSSVIPSVVINHDQKIELTVLEQQNHFAPVGRLSPSQFLENTSISGNALDESADHPIDSATKITAPQAKLNSNPTDTAAETPLTSATSQPSVSNHSIASSLLQSDEANSWTRSYPVQDAKVPYPTMPQDSNSDFIQETQAFPSTGQEGFNKEPNSFKSDQNNDITFSKRSPSNFGFSFNTQTTGTAISLKSEVDKIAPSELTMSDSKATKVFVTQNSGVTVANSLVAESIPQNIEIDQGPRLKLESDQRKTLESISMSSSEAEKNAAPLRHLYFNSIQGDSNHLIEPFAPQGNHIQNSMIAEPQPSIKEDMAVSKPVNPLLPRLNFVIAKPNSSSNLQVNTPLSHSNDLSQLSSSVTQDQVPITGMSSPLSSITSTSLQVAPMLSGLESRDSSTHFVDGSKTSIEDTAPRSNLFTSVSVFSDKTRGVFANTKTIEVTPSSTSTPLPFSDINLNKFPGVSNPLDRANMINFDVALSSLGSQELAKPVIPASPKVLAENGTDTEKSAQIEPTLSLTPATQLPVIASSIISDKRVSPGNTELKSADNSISAKSQPDSLDQVGSDSEKPFGSNISNVHNRGNFSPDLGNDTPSKSEPFREIVTLKSGPAFQTTINEVAAEFSAVEQITALITREGANALEPGFISTSNVGQPTGLTLSSGVKTLSLALEPQDLGSLTIKLRLSSNGLEMHVEAARLGTAQLIEKDKEKLLQGLQDSGYLVDTLVVRSTDNQSAAQQQGSYENPAKLGAGSNQQENQSAGLSLQQGNSNAHYGAEQENRNRQPNLAKLDTSSGDVSRSHGNGDIYI